MISEGWVIRGKLPGKDGIETGPKGKKPVGGYAAYTKVQRQNTAWLQHCKDGMQRKQSGLQTAFIVGSLVLMGGRLFTCLSKAVSRVQPGCLWGPALEPQLCPQPSISFRFLSKMCY